MKVTCDTCYVFFMKDTNTHKLKNIIQNEKIPGTCSTKKNNLDFTEILQYLYVQCNKCLEM